MATGGRSDDKHQAMISNAPGSFNEFKTHLDVCRSSSDVSDVRSSASSTFSVRNARVKLELARLKARQEEELSALEDDLRKLQTRHALQAAETESKVWEMSDDEFLRWVTVDRIRHDNSVKSRDFPPKSQLIDNGRENTPRRLPTLPTHTADSSSANPVPPRLNHALHRRTVDLPKPEIAKFSGDPMEYYSFIRNFKAHVTDLVDDDNVRLSYLLQLCQGEAKNAIDHCSMMEPSRGYREAMRELKNEYGKDRVISRTCLGRLKRGPKLNFDDAKGMQAYARLMRKCGLVLGEISEYDNLNNFDNLLAIVKRLPPESQNAWDFKVATILETEDREASYNDLSKFVTEQANVSRSDFRFARRDRRQSNYYENSKAKGSAFAISASGSNWHCPCCNFSHELFNCKKFKVLSWYERYDVARRNQLCFKCLRRGHMFRQCTQNESCPIHDCQSITHEKLETLLVEVESILNSRPITPVIMDHSADEPLTPNHLLLVGSSPNVSPGVFTKRDCYVRQRWRQVQYLADEFWRRWIKEYLPTITQRSKWMKGRDNFKVDDMVLLVDESIPRGRWTVGRVINTFPDKHGLVRSVLVRTGTNVVRRPITKLCRFLEDQK
ncbi:uncharacterized protein LOC144427151 isoform X1 [Styela clava]